MMLDVDSDSEYESADDNQHLQVILNYKTPLRPET